MSLGVWVGDGVGGCRSDEKPFLCYGRTCSLGVSCGLERHYFCDHFWFWHDQITAALTPFSPLSRKRSIVIIGRHFELLRPNLLLISGTVVNSSEIYLRVTPFILCNQWTISHDTLMTELGLCKVVSITTCCDVSLLHGLVAPCFLVRQIEDPNKSNAPSAL